uniref:Uncharacterized protein n=1 Tax=Astyanax mexicanus TaxID=7994 RepID=A0A3B1J3E8_ASTMX
MALMEELRGWCHGEGLDEMHTVMVLVPVGHEISEIEETLQSVKCLGRVRVRGRKFNKKLDRMMVLCECKGKINTGMTPPEVVTANETWPLITLSECPALKAEAHSPLQDLWGAQHPSSSAESIIRAVGDLLAKIEKNPKEGGCFRRLRTFSGIIPVPSSEEPLESWMDQARMMIEESPCSHQEKRRRIMESLKGPALGLVKAVRTAEPDVTPERLLEAIESAFGTAESGEDLYFAFRLLQQHPGEKLSSFLRRLEQALTKVVRRGGLPGGRVDRARVEQLLRGAVHSDMMLVQLKL